MTFGSSASLGALLALLIAASPASAAAEGLKPLTLADCYRMALKRSEAVSLQAERITETQARFQQALSGILPSLSFSSVDKRQGGDGSSAFTRKYLPERKFAFSQPLFSGFKEFAAMRGSKAEKRLREQLKARAEQLLLVDVSNAYYLLLEQREDLQVLETIRMTLRDRIRELEDRERIGRSRPAELVAVQAQLYRVEADWESAQGDEQAAAQLLGFLTGLDAAGELVRPAPNLPAAGPKEAYLQQAAVRPDVKAAEQAVRISELELKVARAKYFPTVSADGNYYVDRSGASKNVSWDASLNVDVPIFEGGATTGAVKEAASGVRQAQLLLQQTRRQAAQEARDAYVQYDSAASRARALTQALEATDESCQMEVQEYRLNLVNNLEVLSTVQTLQDSRRDLIHALYEARRLYWKLKASAGETPS